VGSVQDRIRAYVALLSLPDGSAVMARHIAPCCGEGIAVALVGAADARPYQLYFAGRDMGEPYIPRGLSGSRSEDGRIALLDADDYMRQGLDAAAIGVLQTHADLGDMRALNALARIRLQRRQYDQALALYERAAKTGHADSQAVMASLYEQGRATEINADEMRYWLREAAASGHIGARMNMALYLLEDGQSREDQVAGARMLLLAAEAGSREAQAAYGLMLYEGRTLLQDRLRGLFWLSLAGQGGGTCGHSLCFESCLTHWIPI
jgi:TPR repeat protein